MVDKLYDSSYLELVKWATAMSGNSALAEDLVQEAFVRALMNEVLLGELTEGQRKAWLYRTIKNLYVDWVRHSSFETAAEILPEKEQEAAYSEIDYLQVLMMLPEEEKMLFVMRYLQGYTSNELGKMLGQPSGTIRSKLSSARKHLRQALSERCTPVKGGKE